MKYFPLLILFFSFQSLAAQIEIAEPETIKKLVDAWEQKNFSSSYTIGWRVQIGASNDLRKAEQMKENFAASYPDIPVDWVQDYPYYKIRVGAFLEKKDTKALIAQLSAVYPGAHATKDDRISISDFK